MRHHIALSVIALAAMAAVVPARASTLSGAVTAKPIGASGWTGTLNVAQASPELSSLVGGAYQIVCLDYDATFPTLGTTHTYSFSSVLTAAEVTYGASAARATDLINWAVDQFYDQQMLTGGKGGSLNSTLWEIVEDFKGTASSLNLSAGNYMTYGATVEANVALLRSSYASIADGYRSTKYTVSFLDDADGTYQNMMMLSPLPTAPVPEPSTLAMFAAGALAMGTLGRRRLPR